MNQRKETPSGKSASGFFNYLHSIDRSALWTIVGVIFLFSFSIAVVLIAPRYIDSTWTSPSSPYQVQMYEVADLHYYLSTGSNGNDLQYVHHLKENFTLLAFKELEHLRIIAPPELEKYITKEDDKELKLTSRLLLLRHPKGKLAESAQQFKKQLPKESSTTGKELKFDVLELYDPKKKEVFSIDLSGGTIQDWVDEHFKIIDEKIHQPFHRDYGVIYTQNPLEFRIKRFHEGKDEKWSYDPEGESVTLQELTSASLDFHSRKELIFLGEKIYAIEGCWYCHTDQTRTLIEDVVINGTDSYPAPPSSANEFIYQKITFPGTRRIGPDISRVGVKRASRDWHIAHFWAPRTVVEGTIMPAFRHFFHPDPRGTSQGRPNLQFEAIYQYMMTKGTRITPPTQAWWLGKDPIKTKEIIEKEKRL